MNLEEKKEYIKKYLKNYFYNWLIRDIKIIQRIMSKQNIGFTLPIILLVCSGIDFSGGLIYRFKKDNVGTRSKEFIKKWMGRIDNLYRDDVLSEILYDCVRCGSIHRAMYKQGVEISSNNLRNNHLCLSKSGNLIINTYQFADDFIKAFRIFRKEYINNNIENIYQNLDEMIRDSNNLLYKLREDNYLHKPPTYFSGTSTVSQFKPSEAP